MSIRSRVTHFRLMNVNFMLETIQSDRHHSHRVANQGGGGWDDVSGLEREYP